MGKNIFNLGNIYNEREKYFKDEKVTFITLTDTEEINQFNFDSKTEKPIEIYLSDVSVRNFFFSNKEKHNIRSIYFVDVNFLKHNSGNYNKEVDFLINNGAIMEVENPYNLDLVLDTLEIKYINNFNLQDNDINIIFSNFAIKQVHIDGGKFLDFANTFDDNVKKFQSLEFCNPIFNEKIEVWNLRLGNMLLDGINENFKKVELRNLEIDNLIIKNSNLGKTIFNGVKIGKLTLENATLNDCIFNGVTFDSYELGNEIDGKEILLEKMKDNYRQLKHVMDKNNNYTEANRFYALEMETYSKVLNIDKNKITIKEVLNNLFFGKDVKNLGDKIILEIGFLINEFGTNWLRNFFVIYLFLIVSYLLVFTTGILEHALLASLTKNGFYPKVNGSKDFLGLINVSSDIMTILVFIGMERCFGNFFDNITKKIKFSLPVFITFSLFIIIPGVIFSLTKNSIYWGDFHGFETFAMLLNPLSGFDLNDAKEVVWTNQIGFIFYKVFYGFLIYQFLVSLRRTTKR